MLLNEKIELNYQYSINKTKTFVGAEKGFQLINQIIN